MKWLSNFLHTSVGRKQLMAVTGILLSLFLVAHLTGNLLLLIDDGGVAFNEYAQSLADLGPLKTVAQIGLATLFIVHIAMALLLTSQNKDARGSEYYYKAPSDASVGARTMILSGLLVLVFLVIHLFDFTLASHDVPGGLYGLVSTTLADPMHGGFYIFSMCLLAFHLSHGIQSLFQTFGVNHPLHTPHIKKICLLLAIGLSTGFAVLPLYFMMRGA